MADHITGMKKLREISATVKGANEHCTKVFQKSFGGQPAHKPDPGDPAPTPTESDMDKELLKTAMLLDGDARTYAAGLEGDAFETFLKKSADDRNAEVAAHVAAEKAKTDAAAEAEKAKAAGDPEVEKLKSELADLKSERTADKAKARDTELREIAKTQYPGVKKAMEVLKSIDGLSEDARKPVLESLAAQAEMAKSLGTVFGDDDADENTGAKAKIDAKVDEVMKTKAITKAVAYTEVTSDPANAALVRQMRTEQAG